MTTLFFLQDGQISSGKYESCVIPVMPMHVVVFSNTAPRIEMMSADRWNIVEIGATVSSSPPLSPASNPPPPTETLTTLARDAAMTSPEIRSESEYDFETDNDLNERDEMTLLELYQLNKQASEDAVVDDEPYVEMVRAILLHEDDDADMQQLLDAEDDDEWVTDYDAYKRRSMDTPSPWESQETPAVPRRTPEPQPRSTRLRCHDGTTVVTR